MKVTSNLRDIRVRRGLSASDLSGAIGVTRQTIHAIEAGTYAPNTAVALKLAQVLEVGVEDLFHLDEPRARVKAEVAGGDAYVGAQLRLATVGGGMIAVPWSPDVFALPLADATVTARPRQGKVDVRLRHPGGSLENRLVIAGCDPAVSILAEQLRHACGVELIAIPSSSREALRMLQEGLVHLAGTHLAADAAPTPKGCRAYTFAEWEEGLVVAGGNPKDLREIADLCRPGVTIINRDVGSGSRVRLDAGIALAGGDPASVAGYDNLATSHLAAALVVKRGDADCCIAPRIAASVFGLGFVALAAERYNLVLPAKELERRPVQALLNTLQRAAFRRELAALGGYDTRSTGAEVRQ